MYATASLFSFFSRNTIVILIYFLSICLLDAYFRTLYTNTYLPSRAEHTIQIAENLNTTRSRIKDHIVSVFTFFLIYIYNFCSILNQTTTIVVFCSITIESFIMTKVFVHSRCSLSLYHLRRSTKKMRNEERMESGTFLSLLSIHFLSISHTLPINVDNKDGLFRFASLNKTYSQRKLDSRESKRRDLSNVNIRPDSVSVVSLIVKAVNHTFSTDSIN